MSDMLTRVADNMIARTTGPLHFRIIMQPLMAVVLAAIDGRKDAKEGAQPFFWTILSDKQHRVERLKHGWKSIGRVFILALALDAIYQFIEQRFVYPGEAVIVAFVLAIVPYTLLRGPFTRLFELRRGSGR